MQIKTYSPRIIADYWPYIRSRMRFKYPELMKTDLSLETHSEEELFSIIQEQLGISREKLMEEIDSVLPLP